MYTQSTYNVDYMINIHHSPHESVNKVWTLGWKGDNLLPLPSNHLIWHDTSGVMIKFIFIMLFIANVIIIIILILCPNEKKFFNLEDFPIFTHHSYFKGKLII
jgi:hypothetical protein